MRPVVEKRVEVAEDGSTLFGSSLGGLLVLHAFLNDPQAFDAYVAVSPALWWDGDVLLAREVELSMTSKDLAAKLVLAVGGLEEGPQVPMLAPYKMVTNVHTLEERLLSREYPSLHLNKFVLDGESHTSVVPVALTRALRAIYPPTWPSP